MTDPTPLEIAAALRSAADFCRDPSSPKTHGRAAADKCGHSIHPLDDDAVAWCAVGWFVKALGRVPGREATLSDGRNVSPAFDSGDYERAALACEDEAIFLEARLMITHSESVGRGSDIPAIPVEA